MSNGLRPDLAETYLAPRDFVESQLVKIWEDVLDVHPVGVKDDFFALGGHSFAGGAHHGAGAKVDEAEHPAFQLV